MFVRGNAARLVAVSCLLLACASDDDAANADAGTGGNGTGGTAPQGGTTGGDGTGGTLEGGSGGSGGATGGAVAGGQGGSGGATGGTTGGAVVGGQGGNGGTGGSTGGAGGGAVPACPACSRLAYCATSDTPDDGADLCSGLNEGQEQAIYDQCVPNCELLSAVANEDTPCDLLVATVATQNPVLAAACPDEGAGGAGGGGGEGGSGGLAPYTQEEVQGVINASCSCHVQGMSGGMSLAVDFTVDTVGVAANGAPVNRIEPGDRTLSYLFHKISGTQGDVGGGGGRMPIGGQLSDEQIERIGLWIDSL